MVANHYRWDFIGLSTDTKPTPETSEKVVNGSTYYCSDTSKLYVFCDGTWYERKPLGGGGGGGGTSDFDELDNRPKYDNAVMTSSTNIPKVPTVNDATLTITQNGVTAGTFTSNDADDTTIALTDTTYSNFTGTDGVDAGTAGLVPAPATTDTGKFLKADGTWDTAGGGGGDTVYSTKTTSNSSTGGAVYIGNLGTDQTEVEDPTTTDNHYKYFWALPGYADSTQTPNDRTVNIMGVQRTLGGTGNITIGWNATTDQYCQNNIIIGDQAFTDSNNSNVVIGAAARNQGENNVVLGGSALNTSYASNTVGIGKSAKTAANSSVAIGAQTNTYQVGSVALGRGAYPTRAGEVHIGADSSAYGFDNTIYRVIGGVHDGQELHDAATVAQGNTLSDSAPTTSTVGVLGQLWTDTTNMHTYQCTAVSGSTYTWTQRW